MSGNTNRHQERICGENDCAHTYHWIHVMHVLLHHPLFFWSVNILATWSQNSFVNSVHGFYSTQAASSHHEHTVRPPVSAVRVSSPVHHLGSHVLHRPTEGVGFVLVVYRLLAQSEVWTQTLISEKREKRKQAQKRCNITHRSAWCVLPRPAGCWNNRNASLFSAG